jgi:hypothetical protein
MPKEMDFGGRNQASDMIGERRGRQIDQIRALRKAERPQRSPVNRNGVIWMGAADHMCRLLGVEMALTKAGSPASDGHQDDVELCHVLARKLRTCVSRIPAAAGTVDKIAKRRSAMRASR